MKPDSGRMTAYQTSPPHPLLQLFGRYAVSMVVAAGLVAGGAGPAFAVDTTGTWSGKRSCRQKVGATVNRTQRQYSTMLIMQRGEALSIAIDGAVYCGRMHESDESPPRVTGSAVRCTNDEEAFTGISEVLNLRIRIDEALGTATIRARSIEDARRGARCRYRFSRMSLEFPRIGPPPEQKRCGDEVVNDALNEECDGAATGTPCDGACTSDCTCPSACEPLDVSGHWEGTWASEMTGESGQVVADFSHDGDFVVGAISFPPFNDAVFSPPLVVLSSCAPATFSTGAILGSGIGATLDGVATNTTVTGTWGLSDDSDHGTWHLSR